MPPHENISHEHVRLAFIGVLLNEFPDQYFRLFKVVGFNEVLHEFCPGNNLAVDRQKISRDSPLLQGRIRHCLSHVKAHERKGTDDEDNNRPD